MDTMIWEMLYRDWYLANLQSSEAENETATINIFINGGI